MKATLSELLAFLVSGRGKASSFYPRIINAIRKEETPGLGTLGVTVHNDALILKYDPEIIAKLTYQEIIWILIHEVCHLALSHIPRYFRLLTHTFNETQRRKYSVIANIAMDYAVNSLMISMGELTKEALKGIGDGTFAGIHPHDVKLPEGKSFEWYVAHIAKNVRILYETLPGMSSGEAGEGAGGEGPSEDEMIDALDDYHSKGAPTSNHQSLEEASKEMTDDQMAGLADKTERTTKSTMRRVEKSSKTRGTIPSQLQSIIDELLKPPSVPWEKVLRRWITNTRRVKDERSLRRPKRRMLVDEPDACAFPGKVTDRTFTLVFGIDTSGSMSDDDLQKCLAELQGVQAADSDIRITIIEADAAIHKEYEITHKSKVDFNLQGRGGTSFDPVFARAKELKPDALIYATDGYAPLPQQENRVSCPVIWVVTEAGCVPGGYYGNDDDHEKYGRIVRITN